RDPRITKLGYFLRKYKIDELPQLINILLGHMSFVGPRPEIPKYVKQYTPYQKQILKVKPGLTSYASVKFSDENKMMEGQPDHEKYYIEKIMPEKINLDMKYVEHHNLLIDFGIIYKTFLKIFILHR
ncbi:MAG: sugar transferase, partial [Deltaproteobacteria bacterium]|nr:sugar transferase [Deltaproteobacteria bacterium]